MEKRIKDIVYDAKCGVCGCPANTPLDWKEHEHYLHGSDDLCKDCGSPNLQPQGKCLVCLDCGYESCNG